MQKYFNGITGLPKPGLKKQTHKQQQQQKANLSSAIVIE
jgi:hypothetical protein